MTRKHGMLFLIAVFFLSLGLVGCGGGGGGSSSGSSASTTTTYKVGGTVSGLSGSGLVLQNNGGDDLSVSANSSFQFATGVADGDTYSVSVLTGPSSPSQTCTVSSGNGTVSGADVSDVAISCTTDSFTVGGSVSGLSGSGLVLQNNAGDDLAISANGNFTFGTSLLDGNGYSVTLATQPTSPDQTCTVSNGSGTLSGSNVSNVTITCATNYTISGTISGMVSGSSVTLQNNGGDDLTLTADGSFTFTTKVSDGSAYAVDVSSQPTGNKQYCNVIYGTGTVSAANVSNVSVSCVDGLFNVVDTNQTSCYNSLTGATKTCSGTGQDGEYNGLQPSYTSYTPVSGESVVLDNNTGLMWQASSDTDGVSGLNTNDKMTYSDAVTYCENLDYGSYSDWRLPNIKALYSIYLMSGEDLSGKPGATTNGATVDHTGVEPFIDTTYFDVGYGDTANGERAIDGQYVSSTLNVSQVMSGITYTWTDAVFGVNFVDGHLKSYEEVPSGVSDATYYVRCVRGNPYYGTNDLALTDSGATVTDNATNLVWEQTDHHSNDFEDALTICNDLTTGGHSDWRLPNAKELESLVDYTNSPDATASPSIDTTYFSSTSFINEAGDTDYGYYWSSTALLNSSGKGSKGAYVTFGRGLGYISNAVVDVHGAGAQRGDGKDAVTLNSLTTIDITGTGCTFGNTAYTSGPQGDIDRVVNNYVRCVRDK